MSKQEDLFSAKVQSQLQWYSPRPMVNRLQAVGPIPYCNVFYRPPNQPILYYVASAFHLTNQTLNIWTHLLPFVYFIHRYGSHFIDNGYSVENYAFPLYLHGFACCTLLLVSFLAHMFGDFSSSCCRYCFATDVSCIFLFCFALREAGEQYFCAADQFCNWPFSLMSTALYVVCLVCCFWGYLFTVYTGHWYGAFFVAATVCIVGVVGFFPCSIRLWSGTLPDEKHLSFYVTFFPRGIVKIVLLLSLSGFIYGFNIPERFSPDTFAIVGNSHQIMHVLTATSMYVQSNLFEAAEKDIRIKNGIGVIPTSAIQPNLWQGMMIGVVLLVVLNTLGTFMFWMFFNRNSDQKRN